MFMNQRSTSSPLSALRLYAFFAGFFLLLCPRFVAAQSSSDKFNFPEEPFAADAMTEWLGQPTPRTCFEFQGKERCYFTFVPSSCKSDYDSGPKLVPLVVDIPALTCNPPKSSWYTGWKEIAEKECLVVMWPSGINYTVSEGSWNVQGGLQSEDYGTEGGNNVTTVSCCYNIRNGPSVEPVDTLFLKKAIDDVVETFSDDTTSPVVIDNSRIYVTGHSNGAAAALAMAALYSDTVAAVAIFAGALLQSFAEDYSGVPIWWVHGLADPLFSYHGMPEFNPPPDPESVFEPTPNIGIWSIDQTLEYLSKHNQCSTKTVTATDEGDIIRLEDCKQDAVVELRALKGIGHFPYNYYNTDPPDFCEFDASMCATEYQGQTKLPITEMAWEFIRSHSKPTSTTSTNSGAKSEL